MRYRLMATYRGVPYEAGVGPTDSDIVLFAACPPPEDLGFQPATGHWRKPVRRAEVDAMWESQPTGTYRDEPCLIIDDLGEQLHISYAGDDPAQAERLGYCQMEPGVYEVLIPREEVTGITEERVERPYPSASPASPAPPWLPADDQPAPDSWSPWPTAASNGTAAPPWLPAEGNGASAPAWPAAPGNGTPTPAWPAAPANGSNGTAAPEATPAPLPSRTAPAPSIATALASPALPASPAAPSMPAPSVPMAAAPAPASLIPSRRGRHGGSAERPKTRQTFSDLVSLAALPPDSYAVDEVVEGAFCLVRTENGFEVFMAADGTRHEVRLFADEEAAYFYLFGLLAAEAVRDGRLVPPRN